MTSWSQSVATNTDSAQRKFERKPLSVTITKAWLRKVGRLTSGLSTRRSSRTKATRRTANAARMTTSHQGSDSAQAGPRSMARVSATIDPLSVATPR